MNATHLYVGLIKTLLPIIINQTNLSRESPFYYDVKTSDGEVVLENTDWNSVPGSWSWNLQKTDGNSWQWEEIDIGTWVTWLWYKTDQQTDYQGGGFQLRSNGSVEESEEVYLELTWEQIALDEIMWMCQVLDPDSYLHSAGWERNFEGYSWRIARNHHGFWTFCNENSCIQLNSSNCNGTIQSESISLSTLHQFISSMGFEDLGDLEFQDEEYQEDGSEDNKIDKKRRKRGIGEFFENTWNKIKSFFSGHSDNTTGNSTRCEPSPFLELLEDMVQWIRSLFKKTKEEPPRATPNPGRGDPQLPDDDANKVDVEQMDQSTRPTTAEDLDPSPNDVEELDRPMSPKIRTFASSSTTIEHYLLITRSPGHPVARTLVSLAEPLKKGPSSPVCQ
uniref:Uncharacterized protein n=1 Tax=Timema bartmani TaxID=61472 RepID=A0A7R9ENA3_9NEOP|nr:unnamed protein product [Timema bartmani]